MVLILIELNLLLLALVLGGLSLILCGLRLLRSVITTVSLLLHIHIDVILISSCSLWSILTVVSILIPILLVLLVFALDLQVGSLTSNRRVWALRCDTLAARRYSLPFICLVHHTLLLH